MRSGSSHWPPCGAAGWAFARCAGLPMRLRVDQHTAAVLLEFCALSGLIRLDVDSSCWVQPPELEWLGLPRQEQWLWLVNAWLASERAPSLVGQPINGQPAGPPSHRHACRDRRQCVVRRGPAVRCARGPQDESWRYCRN